MTSSLYFEIAYFAYFEIYGSETVFRQSHVIKLMMATINLICQIPSIP